jgi:hypothetical protein
MQLVIAYFRLEKLTEAVYIVDKQHINRVARP